MADGHFRRWLLETTGIQYFRIVLTQNIQSYCSMQIASDNLIIMNYHKLNYFKINNRFVMSKFFHPNSDIQIITLRTSTLA